MHPLWGTARPFPVWWLLLDGVGLASGNQKELITEHSSFPFSPLCSAVPHNSLLSEEAIGAGRQERQSPARQ